MKHRKQNFNIQWFDERIEEIKSAQLSDIDRTVILAEAVVLYLERKISYTVFLIIINLIIILAPEPISPDIKRIAHQIKRLKLYKERQPEGFESLYNFTILLEDLVHTLKKLIKENITRDTEHINNKN